MCLISKYTHSSGNLKRKNLPKKGCYFLNFKTSDRPFLNGVRLNIAIEQDNKSFLKLKVKVRDKIVADGLNDETFDVTNKGVHLNAKEFNAMLENPNTVCVDTVSYTHLTLPTIYSV